MGRSREREKENKNVNNKRNIVVALRAIRLVLCTLIVPKINESDFLEFR